jgi:flagellar hook-associated protein 3 FlgL
MIVNKSMFPLQTGFGVISKMQGRFADLQTQLGTGMKASTLADMGRDLPMSLSVRARLSKIEGFSANIATVDLRLSFLDKTMARLQKIESEGRNATVQGQYGTNNINMATLPSLSKARLDEVVTLLNSDVAGRYLFGGTNTDSAPVPDTNVLLDGQGGKAGFKTVLNERKAADAGVDGRGRLGSTLLAGDPPVPGPATASVVNLTEDGVHPFGFKLSNISTTAAATALSYTTPVVTNPPTAKNLSVTFEPDPAEQIQSGRTVTLGFTLPDGSETQITLRATTAAESNGGVDEFIIGDHAGETAFNFNEALKAKLVTVGETELAGASNFAAAENFFNGAGEPVLRVDGDPATATALRVADHTDTVMWYQGQSPAVAAEGLGRMQIGSLGDTATLTGDFPVSAQHGFKITGVSPDTANIDTTYNAATPTAGCSVSATFGAGLAADETVTITLQEPAPSTTTRTLTLTAVSGKAGVGQFTIGTDPTETAANFAKALNIVASEAAIAAEGNPRQSVTSQIDDNTRVAYGIQGNESGLLRLVRTMASLSVETYPTEENILASREPMRLAAMAETDPALRAAALADYEKAVTADRRSANGRFDAMASRQQAQLSASHNAERGSVQILTMELAVAHNGLQSATARHTAYKAQLDNLLSDIETVNKEEVAMEILALQTRLQASYQATSMVSKLSLVNFI